MKVKERMYIDARNEKFQRGDAKEATYIIKDANEAYMKERIYKAVGLHSLKIEVVAAKEKVIITYYENIISPTFIDYLFRLKGIDFTREE